MADASDSKSDVGDYVWVQVPSPALKALIFQGFFYCYRKSLRQLFSHLLTRESEKNKTFNQEKAAH